MSDEAKRTSLSKELRSNEEPRQENTTSSHQVTQSEKADSRSGFVASKRRIVPSRIINSEEFMAERAIDLKVRRAGHLGDVTKRPNSVRDLIAGGASKEEVFQSVDHYEHAFHKFVDAHEKYLRFEDDEGMVAVAEESYEKEIERKFLLDVDISKWKFQMKHETKEMAKSSRHSRRSTKNRKSSCSTPSSVKVKQKIVQEARLKIEALEEKQSLERCLEEQEAEFKRREREIEEERKRNRAELERKLEKIAAETELKKAAVELKIEKEELLSQYSCDGSEGDEANPTLSTMLYPDVSDPPISLPLKVSSFAPPLLDIQTAAPPMTMTVKPEVSSASVISQSDISSLYVSLPNLLASQKKTTLSAEERDFTPRVHVPTETAIPSFASQKEDVSPREHHLSEQRKSDVSPSFAAQSAPQPVHTPLEHVLLQTIQQLTQQSAQQARHSEPKADMAPWLTVAEAFRQGPSLPKIELMKFGGDPSEYSEFAVNFRDHIESQVTDDSQRLTRLLAQCVGKAKEAIKSCVNLPVGQRYEEAWKTLTKNFGQPHMVADAHLRKLRELNIRRGDAASLMDFARRLEDVKRVLTSMGPRYAVRLDNEDMILMLMRKLPDESLKRKWTDIAGDIIQSKGQVSYADFLSFIQKRADRLNNSFGQELKPSQVQHDRGRTPIGRDRQEPPRRATTLYVAAPNNTHKNPGNVRAATLKCYHCSGSHPV